MTARPTSAALRTLPLFDDLAPGLVLPRPRLVGAPRGQLLLFPLPEPTRPRPVLHRANPRQLVLLPGLLPRMRLRLLTPAPGQLPLLPEPPPARRKKRRHLTLVEPPTVDLLAATCGRCLGQADECVERDCRYHLGGVRRHGGGAWSCAVVAAADHPRGASPATVAALLGLTEGEVQAVERRAILGIRRGVAAGRRDEWDELHDMLFSDDPDGACD